MSKEFKLFIINSICIQKTLYILLAFEFLAVFFSIFFKVPTWMDIVIAVINYILIFEFKKIYPFSENGAVFDLPFSRKELALYSGLIASVFSFLMIVFVICLLRFTDSDINSSSKSTLEMSGGTLFPLAFFLFVGFLLINSKLRLDSQWRFRTFVFYSRMFFAFGIMAVTLAALFSPQFKQAIPAVIFHLMLVVLYLVNHYRKQIYNEHLEYKKRLFNPVVDVCILCAFVFAVISLPDSDQRMSKSKSNNRQISSEKADSLSKNNSVP